MFLKPRRWENKLTLTHERVTLPGGKRRVSLTVKPRGVIRWNITAANPKEGEVYSEPIDLAGDTDYGHMHDAAFHFIDADHHSEDWVFMGHGGKAVHAHIDLQRTK